MHVLSSEHIDAGIAELTRHFPDLSEQQIAQFRQLGPLYADWNARINVISRKDFSHFYERHVLHALGIAKVLELDAGDSVLDVGTGGGFPGIPLAILFPDAQFHLVDSIGKKIKVVNAVIAALGLTNVTAEQERAENLKGKYDIVVSRAVTQLPKFFGWVSKKINAGPGNGIYYLKGGDLTEELKGLNTHRQPELIPLAEYFDSGFFETKGVVHIPFYK